MISLYYTSHTKAYNTIYTACNIMEAIYTPLQTRKTLIFFTERYSIQKKTDAKAK